MSHPPRAPGALQACLSCRRQKRKCDKALPSCSLCTRTGRAALCDYSTAESRALLTPQAPDLEFAHGQNGMPATTQLWSDSPSVQNNASSAFPSLFFLDPYMYGYQARKFLKPAHIQMPQHVLDMLQPLISDMSALLSCYFEAPLHRWMPIVSRVRLTKILKQYCDRAVTEVEPDVAALLLCMKLVVQRLDSPSCDHLYQTLKSLLPFVEAQCLLSIHLIQAVVLLAVYEIGHAIYPAAYLSVSHAVALCHATGIHDGNTAPQLLPRESRWTEQEERRRVWWALLLLERYISLPNRWRPLMSPEPAEDEALPTADESWDTGVRTTNSVPRSYHTPTDWHEQIPTPNDSLALSSNTSIPASPFARTCQVVYLLGKYHRHVTDQALDMTVRYADAMQLHNTLVALKALLISSPSFDGLWTSIALCYSGLIALYDVYSCTNSGHLKFVKGRAEMQSIAIDGLRSISLETARFAKQLRIRLEAGHSDADSPLVTDCLYAAGASLLYYIREREADGELAVPLGEIQMTLATLQSRWDVARVYLQELEVQRML